jgi:hypothetical protein
MRLNKNYPLKNNCINLRIENTYGKDVPKIFLTITNTFNW